MNAIPMTNTFDYWYVYDELLALYPFELYNFHQLDIFFNLINNKYY